MLYFKKTLTFLLVVGLTTGLPSACYALPTGWQVVEGNVTFSQDGNVLNITSASDRAIVNYVTFNLSNGETVNFLLPNAGASILNRVLGAGVSNIAGTINSNGVIGLVNTTGINFATSAQVNTVSLLASTLNISNQDFMKGHFQLIKSTDIANGKISNKGNIQIGEGGYAVLAGSGVENFGNIIAPDGTIHLAAGDKVTFHMSNNVSTTILIDEGVQEITEEMNAAIHNEGVLGASIVELKAKLADNLIANSINNDGLIIGTSMNDVGGKIVIESEGGQYNLVSNHGILYAGATDTGNKAGEIRIKGGATYNSGALISVGNEGEKGGNIAMLGDAVINEGAYIDASGDTGGGTVLIGGDYQGSGDTYRAKLNYADENTVVYADAKTTGDGGKIIFWSDDETRFYGSIYAHGGREGGLGGLAEVSGKKNLDFLGYADLTAADGSKGTLLLDPTNITIQSFNPLDLNPDLWLDGADVNGNGTNPGNGSQITTWQDKSGNNRDATQGTATNRPTYQTNVQNGTGAVSFDGNDNYMTVTGYVPATGNGARTLFVTAFNSADNGTGYQDYVMYGTTSGTNRSFGLGYEFNGNNRFSGDYWSSGYNTGYAITSAPHILSGTYDGSTTRYYANGSLEGSQNINLNTGNGNPLRIGAQSNGAGAYLEGDLGDVFSFGRVLSGSERQLLEQYSFAKWNFNVDNATLNNLYLSQANTVLNTQYLEALSQTTDISLQATNDITIANLTNNLLALGGNASLTLNAGNQIVFNDVNDTIRTEGGAIDLISGGGMTLGNLDTRGAGGSLSADITLDAGGTITANSIRGSRVGVETTSGNISVSNVSGSSSTGWNGAADESIILWAHSGDVTASNVTASGAGNIRLQAGSVGDLGAGYNITLSNVNAGQDLALYATGDSAGNGTGTAILVNGASNVARDLTATSFTAGNFFTGTNGAIDITLSSGNMNTALIWTGNNDNISLTASTGNIIGNPAKYGLITSTNDGETIVALEGGDISLTAGGYINTGVNAYYGSPAGSAAHLTVRAGGQSGAGVSVDLYGRLDGNVTVHNTSGAGNAVIGDVFLGRDIGSPLDLNDGITLDVLGTTSVRSFGDVGLYGSFWGPISLYSTNAVTGIADKGSLNIATMSAVNGISLTALQGNLTGGNINSTGGGSIYFQAGSVSVRDKLNWINLDNVDTSGVLTAESWGTSNGLSSGNAIIIDGGSSVGSYTADTHGTNGTVYIGP